MEAECRICLDGTQTLQNKLFSPCLCKGSNLWIHEQCLSQMRQMNTENSNSCPTCKYNYKIESFQTIISTDELIFILTLAIIFIFIFVVVKCKFQKTNLKKSENIFSAIKFISYYFNMFLDPIFLSVNTRLGTTTTDYSIFNGFLLFCVCVHAVTKATVKTSFLCKEYVLPIS